MVNRHGAIAPFPLLSDWELAFTLSVRACGMAVYADSQRLEICGIALARPENIWGPSLAPSDWGIEVDE